MGLTSVLALCGWQSEAISNGSAMKLEKTNAFLLGVSKVCSDLCSH